MYIVTIPITSYTYNLHTLPIFISAYQKSAITKAFNIADTVRQSREKKAH